MSGRTSPASIGTSAGQTAAATHSTNPPTKQSEVTPTVIRLLMGDSTDTAPNEVSRIGTVNIVAQTVQLSALVMTASTLRTSFSAPANGFSSACCSFPANRIRPSVDANESCSPTLAIEYGLTSSRTASAISSAFNPPERRRRRNPPAAVRYISAARSTDGVAPATGTNSSTSGMDTTVPHRLPNNSVQNPTRKPMCSPETATRWLRPAMRNAVWSVSLRFLLPPTSSPVSRPASRSGRACCTAFRQNRAILCGAKRRLSRLESKTSNCTALCSSSVAYAPAI